MVLDLDTPPENLVDLLAELHKAGLAVELVGDVTLRFYPAPGALPEEVIGPLEFADIYGEFVKQAKPYLLQLLRARGK